MRWKDDLNRGTRGIRAVILFVIALIIISCNLGFSPPQQGALLFSDDFSGDDSAWRTWFVENQSAVSVLDGNMVMILEEENTDIFSPNHISHPNVEVTVDIAKKHGSDNNVMGVFCRYKNDENYYGFYISSDGYYGITRMLNGNVTLLSSEELQFSESINRGNETNRISTICQDGLLELIINNEQIVEARDDKLQNGRTGLMIGSFSKPEDLVVLFDNFEVRAK